MPGPEAADQVGHEPAAERVLEGQGHGAAVGVEELVHGRDAVVEVVQHGVHVPLEHGAGQRHPQGAPGLAQQRSADLGLEPGQRARHAGLGDRLDLAHLGHRRTVRDLLKPAQRIGVKTHDSTS